MATEVSYTGDGADKTFDITFPYLKIDDVKVELGGNLQTNPTHYSISGTVVTFVTAPANAQAIKIYRDTVITAGLHDYSAGSSVRATSLNENQLQALYAIEEAKLVTTTSGGITTGSKNDVTVNSDTDWVINDSAVITQMIADDAITADKIANDALTGSNMHSNTITTIKLVNNVITTEKLAADAVDGTKIADDAINSEHYVDGSIDTAHIADDQITLAKMAGGTDGNLITYDASGDPAYVATGSAGQLLTSNGTGAAPTFQSAGAAVVPIGSVIWYAGSSAPTGYLKANGDAIANGSGTTQGVTANFAALYAIVGANLPDLRGEFVRGWDDGKGTDSGRTIRSSQAEAYKEHNHPHDVSLAYDVDDPGHAHDMTVRGSADSESTSIGTGKSDQGNSSNQTTHSETTGIDIDVSATIDINNAGGTETRPRNVALLACIKY